jgi:cell division protein FtsZ
MLNFDNQTPLKPIIKIIGVGGAGNNAVNRMYNDNLTDVEFAICHTDAQKLNSQQVPEKINIGRELLNGSGTGNNVEKGKNAALESISEIDDALHDSVKMIFLAAGLGKGTGTGATIEIAKRAKAKEKLSIAVVTLPSKSEGRKINSHAYEGVKELRKHTDALIIINNPMLMKLYGDLPLSQCYAKADDVIATAVRGISELITLHGHINLDFADVNTILKNSGITLMGGAKATGKDRAKKCIVEALNSPLLNNNDIAGASDILLNIISGEDEITMDEVTIITDYVQKQADGDSNIIWGITNNPDLKDEISITIVATGFEDNNIKKDYTNKLENIMPSRSSHTIEDYIYNPHNEDIISDLINESAYARKLKRLEEEEND